MIRESEAKKRERTKLLTSNWSLIISHTRAVTQTDFESQNISKTEWASAHKDEERKKKKNISNLEHFQLNWFCVFFFFGRCQKWFNKTRNKKNKMIHSPWFNIARGLHKKPTLISRRKPTEPRLKVQQSQVFFCSFEGEFVHLRGVEFHTSFYLQWEWKTTDVNMNFEMEFFFFSTFQKLNFISFAQRLCHIRFSFASFLCWIFVSVCDEHSTTKSIFDIVCFLCKFSVVFEGWNKFLLPFSLC